LDKDIIKGIEIVNTKLDHIDDIIAIENLSFSIPWSKKTFWDELKNNEFAIYLSAKVEDKVVGYAGMWKIVDEGHITNIAVHPKYRQMGVGSKLLEALMKRANTEGITKMTLEVRRNNKAARHLYEKYGFTVYGIRKEYYADNGEDALIMWCELPQKNNKE